MSLRQHIVPVVAPLLRRRAIPVGILGLAGAQVLLAAGGLPGWPCPVRHLTGFPCPGCGLTRGSLALLRGQWAEALQIHALAPLAVMALALLFLAAVLPSRLRARLAAGTEAVERRTGAVYVSLALLLVYYGWRAMYCPGQLSRLAGG